MSNADVLQELVDEYFATRPNLTADRPPLCIFFLACSGAGKSTLRRRIVEELHATYVCNDEVRILLSEHPESEANGIGLKDVVTATWHKILIESPNKTVVFDNNIIQYYRNPDSYINVARHLKMPYFVVNLDIPEATLRARIEARSINTRQILAELPGQLADYAVAAEDMQPDWVLHEDYSPEDVEALMERIKELL